MPKYLGTVTINVRIEAKDIKEARKIIKNDPPSTYARYFSDRILSIDTIPKSLKISKIKLLKTL